ncbi:hypothetical protein B0T45_19810 [Chromobacterium haemolyticum]|uniref:Uncharacterized protein n=1 Tax=Chromobacterium haemolyticum TaxID=394935 RepID=A0A1W0CGI0_9NEIS|nr:hypothetical protein B0T45_19810 [Chromobacterium haemolyticum]
MTLPLGNCELRCALSSPWLMPAALNALGGLGGAVSQSQRGQHQYANHRSLGFHHEFSPM